MEILPKGYVRRCYGLKYFDVICAVGNTGGGIGRNLTEYGSEYLQKGELDKLRSDGVREITIGELLRLEAHDVKRLKTRDDPRQMGLFS
jgi:hypothetical protein